MPIARRGALYFTITESDLYFDFIQEAPGHKKVLDDGQTMVAATGANLRCFRRLYPDTKIEDADGTLCRIVQNDASGEQRLHPITPIEHLIQIPEHAHPYPHQRRAVDVCVARKFYGFWHEQGTGKSAEIIWTACELFLRGEIKQALVVTRNRGIRQFRTEQIPEWRPPNVCVAAFEIPCGTAFPILREDRLVIGITGSTSFQSPSPKAKRKAKKIPGPLETKRKRSLAVPTTMPQILEFCQRAPTALFIDESQDFKSWTSLRVENLQLILPHCHRRYLYSGESKPKNLEDLFPQFYAMHPDILGHPNITSFRGEFCDVQKYGEHQVIGFKNEDRLSALMAPHCEYVRLRDCVADMPPQITCPPLTFTPTREQRDLYEQVKKTFIATVRGGAHDDAEIKHVCQTTAAQLITLQQIADGWFYGDPPRICEFSREEIEAETPLKRVRGPVHVINDERALATIEESILSNDQKTIIWAAFHEDLASLCRMLKKMSLPHAEYSGRISAKELEINKSRFINDPSIKIWIGTQAMGGTSLNLQVANRMIWFSHTYCYGDYDQAVHRTWRIGQTLPCFYTDMIGFGIDQMKRNNLRKKQSTSEMLRSLVNLRKIAEEL